MAEVFIQRDPLLAQQAQIVPFYWLIREVNPDNLVRVRAFLVEFDEARRANKNARDAGRPRDRGDG